MPFIHNTPESLLRRSDSRNPATTCKGVTTSGSHCCRSIVSSSLLNHHFPLSNSRKYGEGVLAVLEPANDEGAAAFFCWQHKDQAITLTSSVHEERTTNIVKLKKRTSVDTLIERLGLLDTNGQGNGKPRKKTRRQWTKENPARKDTLPKNWQDVDGTLLAVHSRRSEKTAPQPRRKKKPRFFMALCCMKFPDDDPLAPVRVHVEDEKASRMGSTNEQVASQSRPLQRTKSNTLQQQQQQQSHRKSTPTSPRQVKPPTSTSVVRNRPTSNRDPSSQTQTLLSFIPKTLSPQTTSALLAELAKPVSTHDEAGYIYIFWLTPSSSPSRPDDDTASSLLAADTLSPPTTPRGRRKSEIISAHRTHNDDSKTLLLKIGRAANVQRRMNQWTRQCGYDLSLIRFYPYLPSTIKVPSSPLPSPRGKSWQPPSPEGPVKVPCAHKVERLIHLELAEKRVKEDCGACGREHKEWFEVRGTREGLRDVDCVVRRWVRWAQEG